MAVRAFKYSNEEAARLGNAIYDREVRPKMTGDDHGKFVAIDMDTGEWEMDPDEMVAGDRLRGRLPDAQIWMTRVGYGYIRSLALALCGDRNDFWYGSGRPRRSRADHCVRSRQSGACLDGSCRYGIQRLFDPATTARASLGTLVGGTRLRSSGEWNCRYVQGLRWAGDMGRSTGPDPHRRNGIGTA